MSYEKEEFFAPGHGMCAGCAAPIIVRWILKLAGPNTIVTNATGCLEVATTAYPRTSWRVPWLHVAFENAAAAAAGVEAAAKAKGEKLNIIAFGGDGGTVDIGMQALSGMVERGHNVLYVLYDNEAYMNTGIQRSGATPWGAWTTTSKVGKANPIGKLRPKKPIARIVAAHGASYVATANPAVFQDFKKKIQKALSYDGAKFLHVLSSCTTGWRHDPSKTIEILRLATDTGLFPLWEVVDGDLENMRITYKPKKFKPIEEYLKMQGRFRHLLKNPEYVKKLQEDVNAWWEKYGYHYNP